MLHNSYDLINDTALNRCTITKTRHRGGDAQLQTRQLLIDH